MIHHTFYNSIKARAVHLLLRIEPSLGSRIDCGDFNLPIDSTSFQSWAISHSTWAPPLDAMLPISSALSSPLNSMLRYLSVPTTKIEADQGFLKVHNTMSRLLVGLCASPCISSVDSCRALFWLLHPTLAELLSQRGPPCSDGEFCSILLIHFPICL